MSIKKPKLHIPFALLLAGMVWSCADEMDPTTQGMPNNNNNNSTVGVGADAPSFSLTSVDGGLVSLSDFSGKPLVIFFFGSSCPNCIAGAPSVESKIHQVFSSDKMAIVGIDTWDGNESTVKNFRNTTDVTFDLLLNGSSIETKYNTTYDRLFVVDGEGKVAFKGNSSAAGTINEVVTVLEGLIQ